MGGFEKEGGYFIIAAIVRKMSHTYTLLAENKITF